MDKERILVLGDYRQTVTVVRSLARTGYAVILGTDDRRSATALSRHVESVWTYERGNAAHFGPSLEAYLRNERPDFVFIVGESQLRWLMPHMRSLDSLTTWVAPAWPVVQRCFSKSAMYALCDALSVPTAPWRTYTGKAAWRMLVAQTGCPVVVKRRDSSALVSGRKVLILESAAQAEDFLRHIDCEAHPVSLILQKFAPGVRHNCHFAADSGQIVAYFEQRVARTDLLDMTGIGIEGVSVAPSRDLRAWCERLTKSLGYHGIGCIQFLVDAASGSASFLEINPRMDSTAVLPYRLGYDFPRLAVDLARRRRDGTDLALPPPEYPIGRRYHWLYGDVLAWHDVRNSGERSAARLAAWALRSAWIAMTSHHLTWDTRDPLPTLYAYWRQLRAAVFKRVRLQVLLAEAKETARPTT